MATGVMTNMPFTEKDDIPDHIQDVIDRADDVIARAEALAAANDWEMLMDTNRTPVSGEATAGFVDGGDESTFNGMFVNSREANAHSAQKYQEKARIERHEAELDRKKGDYAAMRNHLRLAESYQKMADQYAKDAMNSTK